MNNISESEFRDKYLPFIHEYDRFIARNLIPEAIAYYLKEAKNRNCLVTTSFKNHINSALDSFNIDCNIDLIIPLIKDTLNKKYGLKITQDNPLILDKITKEKYYER